MKYRVQSLSTKHVDPHDFLVVQENADPILTARGARVVFPIPSSDVVKANYSSAFLGVCTFFANRGTTHILFDPEERTLSNLPTYDWSAFHKKQGVPSLVPDFEVTDRKADLGPVSISFDQDGYLRVHCTPGELRLNLPQGETTLVIPSDSVEFGVCAPEDVNTWTMSAVNSFSVGIQHPDGREWVVEIRENGISLRKYLEQVHLNVISLTDPFEVKSERVANPRLTAAAPRF